MRVLRIGLALLAALALGMAGVLGFAYLAPERASAIVIDADRARSGLTRKEMVLPDGLRYAYLEGGSPAMIVRTRKW